MRPCLPLVGNKNNKKINNSLECDWNDWNVLNFCKETFINSILAAYGFFSHKKTIKLKIKKRIHQMSRLGDLNITLDIFDVN